MGVHVPISPKVKWQYLTFVRRALVASRIDFFSKQVTNDDFGIPPGGALSLPNLTMWSIWWSFRGTSRASHICQAFDNNVVAIYIY